MGRHMSALPSWARTAPSWNSTREWTMLSRWTTIWIFSGDMAYSRMASMNSSPLFIRVAESMVILAPMAQLGCFRACAFVTMESSSQLFP